MPGQRLAETLHAIANAAPAASGNWWIIGSGALVLSGIDIGEPHDIDLFTDRASALVFLDYWKQPVPPPQPDPHFRSDPFARICIEGLLPIDLLADLHLHENGHWNPVRLESRIAVDWAGATVFVPSLEEQHTLFLRFGRKKDRERAALIGDRLSHRQA
ncbi:hypothetical protein [Hoeflea prorocentri]|uniref:Uncharacterized protein n=1 Tax=Hoeflea prorocentri TaxID=1922333 RepID=A0A9X3UEL1_9HYPH|nr:hypothetical protein [Hoeflea prorocentri]MCY6379285.1 hypothetical protein [Hoeflea prorocentri]MDA5397086.1 hypothetical protein [Hoeflea prorocentri]